MRIYIHIQVCDSCHQLFARVSHGNAANKRMMGLILPQLQKREALASALNRDTGAYATVLSIYTDSSEMLEGLDEKLFVDFVEIIKEDPSARVVALMEMTCVSNNVAVERNQNRCVMCQNPLSARSAAPPIYIYIYTYIHIYIYTYTYLYTYTYTYTHIYIHIYIYIYAHTHTHIYIHICVYVYRCVKMLFQDAAELLWRVEHHADGTVCLTGAQFTCFTGTKVQILTQRASQTQRRESHLCASAICTPRWKR